MNWNKQKRGRFYKGMCGLKGKKNCNNFRINDYATDYPYRHLGWYIAVDNIKINKIFNSLWKDIWFSNIDDAKEWCENFKWEDC